MAMRTGWPSTGAWAGAEAFVVTADGATWHTSGFARYSAELCV
ncbi:hypothetical protein [Streptomyces sp. NPDC005322]